MQNLEAKAMYALLTSTKIIEMFAIKKMRMSSSVIICRLCKIPLTTEEQFIGHYVISHELSTEDAEHAWQITSSKDSISDPRRRGGLHR